MIATAKDLLTAFDSLPADEQQQAAVEIIRRSAEYGELTESALGEMASELFRSYDGAERVA